MILTAQAVGLIAVTTFVLSYQQKKRKNIILLNSIARVLYIIQYLLLGAFEGAALDVLGTFSSICAQNKDKGFLKRYTKGIFWAINLITVAVGLVLYKNIFSLFPLIGVILHTSAFWIDKEKTIRLVSFLGSPFWLCYNLASSAFGSALGDVFTMISIGLAIFRYDIKKDKNTKNMGV